jgi:hypothetical protein
MVTPLSVWARVTVPSSGQFAGQDFQQRGLARAIGADQTDAVAALDAQREVLDDRAIPNRLVTCSATITDLVLLSSLAIASLAAPAARHRGALGAHCVQLFQAAHVALAPRGHPAVEPVFLDLELGVELVGGARFLGVDLFHPRFIAAKADFAAAQAAPVQPQRRAGQPGEEGTVVADHHEGAVERCSHSSSQSIAARSRWLVGSSSSSTSGSCARARAALRGAVPARGAFGPRERSMPNWSAMASTSWASGASAPCRRNRARWQSP